MKPSQSVEVQLADEKGEHVAIDNVLVDLYFYTSGIFRYAFRMGRTDKQGRLVIAYVQVEEERFKNAEFFVMDYNTKLEDCDERLEVVIPSEAELREQCAAAITAFRAEPPWAKNWPANLHISGKRKLITLTDEMTHVDIPVRLVNSGTD